VVSKDRIGAAVWGLAADLESNVVEVYVSHLRRKIGAARVQTVRGLGYRLVNPDG
jgi:DNA-binding response OmpR family regulator